jgi:hypothetical protein
LTDEVHRHDRLGQSGGLWQNGYRVPCNCAEVGGLVEGYGRWDAFLLGHHYRCTSRGRQISPDELDVAVQAGKVKITVANQRVVHCTCCRILVAEGAGRRVWVDGFCRGFLGPECWKGLLPA